MYLEERDEVLMPSVMGCFRGQLTLSSIIKMKPLRNSPVNTDSNAISMLMISDHTHINFRTCGQCVVPMLKGVRGVGKNKCKLNPCKMDSETM